MTCATGLRAATDALDRRGREMRHLRTRDGFRRFFTGVPRARMAQLLTEAFAGQPPEEAAARREKRLALLADVLAD